MNMKKLFALLLAAAMMLSMVACGVAEETTAAATEAETTVAAETTAEATETTVAPETTAAEAEETTAAEAAAPVAEEVRGITVPAFSITVNGVEVTNDMMADYALYQVTAVSTNSSGTESTTVYAGFRMADVFAAAGLAETYVWLEATADDGYAVEYTGDIMADTTLLAVVRDGAQFKAAPWFAPCASVTTGDYLKGCVSILVNTVEGAPEIDIAETGAAETTAAEGGEAVAPEKEDKTDKVTFADFSFQVNGTEVNNAALEGLSIYKVNVTTENSNGESAQSTYTGYVLADVLKACGIENAAVVKAVANDGYENELTAEQAASEYTIVAIEKDKETGEDGTIWVAPCTETSSKAYAKNVVEIVAEAGAAGTEATETTAAEGGEAAVPDKQDKTDKVTFGDFSFKVNGNDVTNATLEGLSIFKVAVTVVNSKGESSDATYTGYVLADVLNACGIENAAAVKAVANDGYEVELTAEQIASEYTIVAIEKDKETGEDGTVWVAPCTETVSGSYAKCVVEIAAE